MFNESNCEVFCFYSILMLITNDHYLHFLTSQLKMYPESKQILRYTFKFFNDQDMYFECQLGARVHKKALLYVGGSPGPLRVRVKPWMSSNPRNAPAVRRVVISTGNPKSPSNLGISGAGWSCVAVYLACQTLDNLCGTIQILCNAKNPPFI